MSDIYERVERGAAFLDEKRPGWWREIDLSLLDIRSACNCVIGQLHNGRYVDGVAALGIEREAPDYGMELWRTDFAPVDAHWILMDLTDAWSELIQQRRRKARVTA